MAPWVSSCPYEIALITTFVGNSDRRTQIFDGFGKWGERFFCDKLKGKGASPF